MSCVVTIDFTGTPDSVVTNIQTKVLANNGTFEGNDASGSFTVPVPTSHIDGSYNIIGQQITIEISNKPFFLTCGQIQDYVEGNLIF